MCVQAYLSARCRIVLSTALLLLLLGCSSDLSLEPQDNPQLSFSSLPYQVQQVYERYQEEATRASEGHPSTVWDASWQHVTTDPSIDFRSEKTTMEDGFLTLLFRGFSHHFYIQGKYFRLNANQGEPFVLHEGRLYYSLELNLHEAQWHKAQDASFVEVDLRSALEDT